MDPELRSMDMAKMFLTGLVHEWSEKLYINFLTAPLMEQQQQQFFIVFALSNQLDFMHLKLFVVVARLSNLTAG